MPSGGIQFYSLGGELQAILGVASILQDGQWSFTGLPGHSEPL